MEKNQNKLEKAIVKSLEKNLGRMAKIMANAALRNSTWGYVIVSITPDNPNK